MNIKYFRGTDTALLEFSDRPVDETREISEHIYVDLDKDGNLVSVTIEHAQQAASLPQVSVEEIEQGVAWSALRLPTMTMRNLTSVWKLVGKCL